MTRLIVIIALGLGLAIPLPAIAAGNCAVEKYSQEGSLVDVQACRGKLTIKYTQPRQELIKRGVSNNSMMFSGSTQPGGAISGHALAFDTGCAAVAFAVTGSRRGSSIILQGQIPVRDNTCQISRFQAYNTVISPAVQNAAANPGAGNRPQVETPSCPAGYAFSNGQCMSTPAPQAIAQPAPAPAPTPASANLASATLAPAADAGVKQKLSGAELASAIQQELARLGCNPGPVDGDWGLRTRNALGLFNQQASANLDASKPSETMLPILKSVPGVICPQPAIQARANPKKSAPKKKVVKSSKKKTPVVAAKKKSKKKEYWGGAGTRLRCEGGHITADCF